MRAVLVDPAFIGDVVFDGPFARTFKELHPAGELGIVVRPSADAVARRLIGVDRVHVFDKRGRDRGLFGLLRLARELAAQGYEVAYVPHPSVRSTALVRQAAVPRRIGSAPGAIARSFLTEVVPALPGDTFVKARLRLLGAEAGDERLEGTLRADAPPRTDRRARIGLVLGSNWETKRWDPGQARDLARRIDSERHRLVFLGGEQERALYTGLDGEDRLGGSVSDLIDQIAGLDVMVAGDTGPLHIARALGIRTVALFGPTSEARHPFTPLDRVLTEALECRPCSAHGGRSCPEGHHRCMKELSGERVFGAVVEALS